MRDESAQAVLGTMRRYIAAGLSVVPILRDGSKKPAVAWKVYQSRKATDEELQQWATAGYGIAVLCGEISGGLEVLDNDDISVWPEYRELLESHAPGLFKRLVWIRTPSGCNHLAWRCAEIVGNQKLALRPVEVPEGTHNAKLEDGRWIKLEVLFETRGEGGYIVAPGSPLAVHNARKPYEFLQGDFDHIATITEDERALILGLASALNEHHPKEREGKQERVEYRPAAPRADGDLRPGDDFCERGDPLPVLLNHGWTVSHQRGQITYLKKPGKRGRGHQATLGAVAPNVFYNFSTSVMPFDAPKSYSAFQVYALLEHNGDFKAAAADLAAQGYGSQRQDPRVYVGSSQEEPPKQINIYAECETIPEHYALRDWVKLSDVAALLFGRWSWDSEDRETFTAINTAWGGRKSKTFRVRLIDVYKRIKGLPDDATISDRKAAERFARDRIKKLRVTIEKTLSVELVSIVERGGQIIGDKRLAAKYKIVHQPFLEAKRLAEQIYSDKVYNGESVKSPGAARELACAVIGDKYLLENAKAEVKAERAARLERRKEVEREATDAHATQTSFEKWLQKKAEQVFAKMLEEGYTRAEIKFYFENRAADLEKIGRKNLDKKRFRSPQVQIGENLGGAYQNSMGTLQRTQNGEVETETQSTVFASGSLDSVDTTETREQLPTGWHFERSTGRAIVILGWVDRDGEWLAEIEGDAALVPFDQIEFVSDEVIH